MAGNSTRRGRRQKLSVNVPTGVGNWSTPLKLDQLGASGLLSRLVLRAQSGSTLVAVDILIYYGADYDATTDPDTVPDEDRAYDETAIAITGSGTVADADRNLLALYAGIVYDVRGQDDTLWLAIENSNGAGLDLAVVASVEARDTL